MNGLDPRIPLEARTGIDPMQRVGQAFELAGAFERQKQMQEQRQDQQTVQEYLRGGGEFTTPEGITAATQSLKGKISAGAYQQLVDASQNAEANRLKQQEMLTQKSMQELKMGQETNAMIGRAVSSPLEAYDKIAQQKGQGKVAADAQWPQIRDQAVQQVAQMVGPNGQPLVNPQQLQAWKNASPEQARAMLKMIGYQDDQMKAAMDRKLEEARLSLVQSQTQEVKEKIKTQQETRKRIEEEIGGGALGSTYKAGGTVSVKNEPIAQKQAKASAPWMTDDQVAMAREQSKQLNKSITGQQVLNGKIAGFERGALKNLEDLAKELEAARKKGTVDIPLANKFNAAWRQFTGQVSNEGVALFGTESAAELAKLASSASASGAGGTLTDREHWNSFFSPNASFDQMMKSITAARKSAENRRTAAQEQMASDRQQIVDLWSPPPDWEGGGAPSRTEPSRAEPTPAKSTPKLTYSSEADAEAAFKAGKLKKGDRVTIGGVSGTWQ